MKYSLEESIAAVKEAIETSQLLKDVAEVRKIFEFDDNSNYRKLLRAEQWQMEQQGVRCENWDNVLVSPNFDSSRVQNCTLQGNIRLGDNTGYIHLKRRAIKLPSGVYNCDLKNVVVGDGAYVSRTSLLHNVYVGADSCVMGCGEVVCTGNTSFGNGQALPLIIETGGRETGIFAEMTVAAAAGVATNRSDKDALARYDALLEEYKKKASSPATIVGPGSRVMHTPKVTNVYMGRGAIIDSAVWVEESTMLSTLLECAMVLAGCEATGVLMQGGSTLQGISMVTHAVLCKYSTVCHHGKVLDSIVGPGSYVAEGECTAVLLGPHVLLDHQALLIACLWTEGRGTVGYGANVGSNHTSKAPDQELWSGEGNFYGVGCCIKYPTDFSRAPHSVVNSGTICLPQRMTFPFSLISSPAHNIDGISPAYNELHPAWALSHNIEGLRRREAAMNAASKSCGQTMTSELLRQDIVDLMKEARANLQAAEGKALLTTEQGESVYTDKQIPGSGKNYIFESVRLQAIDTYTFYIQYYALIGLYKQLLAGASPASVMSGTVDDTQAWQHQRNILLEEMPGATVQQMLEALQNKQGEIHSNVVEAKEIDSIKGRAIIRDYEEAHSAASANHSASAIGQQTETISENVAKLLLQLTA